MCAIVGSVLKSMMNNSDIIVVNSILEYIWKRSHTRGRDGRGFNIGSTSAEVCHNSYSTQKHDGIFDDSYIPKLKGKSGPSYMLGNLRAEPTTEFVKDKNPGDQQPYHYGKWSVVHNGTIANDKELRTGILKTNIDSAAIVEQLVLNGVGWKSFIKTIKSLKGSYAIMANHEFDSLFVAVNYRPLWYAYNEYGVFFASARDFFPDNMNPVMLPPYSAARFTANAITHTESLYPSSSGSNRALVVCSGGLDSVVSAAYTKSKGMEIELIHFLYGSRAEGPEVEAVKAVAEYFKCKLTLFPLNVYSKSDSPLLDKDSPVAGGEAGAEFAHEWVPARNLLLLSVATAFAEAQGIETIVLGNNLEEAGAYPDNEPEFISRYNDMLPFAVGDGKRMKVIMPVGNMMKHEIVALGEACDAPMHLTWSCYRSGQLHCGKCGPCYMRRKAFEINNMKEVINYKE